MSTTSIFECCRRSYRQRVLFGTPERVSERRNGRVCYFGAGAIIGYEFGHGARAFGCVFRAGRSDGELAVPGVRPAVRMLISFCRGRRFGRALALLQELDARGVLMDLPDAALLRASVALSTRVSTAMLADAISHDGSRPWIS
jgi:pentatricopeptide repeat protein